MTKLLPFTLLLITLCVPSFYSVFYLSKEPNYSLFIQSSVFIFCVITVATIIASRVKKNFLKWIVVLALSAIVFIFEILESISYYLQGRTFNDQFFFHFNPETLITGWGIYLELPVVTVLLSIWFILLVVLLAKSSRLNISKLHATIAVIALSLAAGLVSSAPKRFVQALQLSTSTNKFATADLNQALSNSGLNPLALRPLLPRATAGKNLVFIYLESLEQIYSEETIFKDLTPTIHKLFNEGILFNKTLQIPGASWSMGSMFTSQCGTPLLVDGLTNGNDLMHNRFLTEAPCLGDILADAGYNQTFMVGSSVDFAGMGSFYRSHQFNEALGLHELQPLTPDPSYRHSWGLQDDTLFELAADKYLELANKDKPFNLTLITTDTHHPVGHKSRSCPNYPEIENTILDAVYCADKQIEIFLDKIKKHPKYKDTIIVIYSDHLAMRNVAEPLYPKDYQRRLLFLVLNSPYQGTNEALATPVDVAPTILDLIQVKHNAQFLAGQNLLSKEPRRTIDFSDPETINLLRWTNSNFYTHKDSNLCEEEVISYDDSSIRIGQRQIALSYEGHSGSTEKKLLEGKITVTAVFNRDLQITEGSILSKNKLKSLLSNKGKNESLTVLTKKALKKEQRPIKWDDHKKIRVAHVSANREITVIASFDKLSELHLSRSEVPSCKIE